MHHTNLSRLFEAGPKEAGPKEAGPNTSKQFHNQRRQRMAQSKESIIQKRIQ